MMRAAQLPQAEGRLYSMLTLPLSDPDASMRQIEAFGESKYVTGMTRLFAAPKGG
jgi:hypothetical protein